MDDLVRVYASGDTFAAELMRGRLESEDIPVLVKGEGEGPYRMGPCYLWVSAEDATRARVIVDAVESGDFALADEEASSEASNSTGEQRPG
jgi:Putative prokaryotic signal transducing protein